MSGSVSALVRAGWTLILVGLALGCVMIAWAFFARGNGAGNDPNSIKSERIDQKRAKERRPNNAKRDDDAIGLRRRKGWQTTTMGINKCEMRP